ncbi:MAG: SpoIIE family protein phosphatase [Planctomycetota bacterium]
MNRRRVLVVDDEPGMVHALRRILERSCELVCCAHANEALAVVDGFEPELALLDVRLPHSDGFELMRRLKKKLPGLDVILMTGSLTDIDSKLIRSLREEAFFFLQKPFDRELLLTLLERWQERRQLAADNRDYVARLEEELRQARAFQQRMLPGATRTCGGVALRGRYLPCDSLGGDFYDWAEPLPGVAVLLVADVAGHGVAAAMLTGFVKSAFHAAHVDGYAPASVAARVRDGLRGLDEGSFVTLLCARVDPTAGRLDYVSCGHPYGVLVRPTDVVPLEGTGPLLSPAFPDVDCGVASLVWNAHDRLVLWTDGIEEAADVGGALFGRDRLLRCLAGAADGVLDLIETEVRTFVGQRPLRDDCTLVLAAGGVELA